MVAYAGLKKTGNSLTHFKDPVCYLEPFPDQPLGDGLRLK
jgi:hypothetical protein